MKRLRLLTPMAVLVLVLFAIGCSSGTTDGLKQRVAMFDEAINSENWFDAYELSLPEFRAVCRASEFVNKMMDLWEEYKEEAGVDSDGKVVFQTRYIRVEGNYGYATSEIDILDAQGRYVWENFVPPDADTYPVWEFIDGEWYFIYDYPADCALAR